MANDDKKIAPKIETPVGRRTFLHWMAGVALVGATSTFLSQVLGQARVGLITASHQPEPQKVASAQPAGAQKARVRQWAMVIDLRQCEGCTTIDEPPQCTAACIKEHFVPAGQRWIEVYERESAGGGSFFMPTPCFHCENAPCANVCPVGATYHNENGLVLVDHERCVGCRLCMAACPYQRRFFNWGDTKLPPEAALASYSPEYPVPAKRGTVIKCMFCAHRAAQGKLPVCVTGCPMNALYFADLDADLATNGKDLMQLSTFLAENSAFRYKEELGTQPRVWYIPGHGQAFGVHAQGHKKRRPDRWPLAGS